MHAGTFQYRINSSMRAGTFRYRKNCSMCAATIQYGIPESHSAEAFMEVNLCHRVLKIKTH